MRKLTTWVLAGTVMTSVAVQAEKPDYKDENAKLGYSMGYNMGLQIKGGYPDINLDALAEGLKAAYDDSDPRFTAAEMQQVLQSAQQKAQQARMEMQQKQAADNRKQGEAFLADNSKKDGVKVTDSGLQYEVLKKGKGKKPAETDTVTVHYHGTLPDGTVFDSSVERDEPATFALNRVIKGWTEGVQLMEVGSKYRFVIPSDLAYGTRGAGQKIGPNQVLIFEVELLEVKG